MIITLDGPAGTGKSTIAKRLSQRLNFAYIDTGAMYRSITYVIKKKHIALNDLESISNLLNPFPLKVVRTGDRQHYFFEEEEITDLIRSQEVTDLVSDVAQIEVIRSAMVSIQRQLAEGINAIFEGRDLGSVVFPEAELKFFLTARLEVCARRRYKEILLKHGSVAPSWTEEMVRESLDKRNQQDSSRKISPLKQPEGAIVIDTSDLTIDEIVEKILEYYYHNADH
jgi:cytidylate kinase